MPKTTRNNSKPAQQERSRFVSVDLTVKQKADMKSRFTNSDEVFEWLFKMVEEGYKFTFKWDDWNNAHACFIYPGDEDMANGGYVLCGRGSTPRGALTGALYRHYIIFEGVWGNRDHQSVDDD